MLMKEIRTTENVAQGRELGEWGGGGQFYKLNRFYLQNWI